MTIFTWVRVVRSWSGASPGDKDIRQLAGFQRTQLLLEPTHPAWEVHLRSRSNSLDAFAWAGLGASECIYILFCQVGLKVLLDLRGYLTNPDIDTI